MKKRVESPGDDTGFCIGICPALAKIGLERGTQVYGVVCIYCAWPGHPAVVRDSQVPLCDLWQGFSPHRLDESWFVIFRGYMDESYGEDKNVFAWSCLIATGSHWFKVERQWKLHLRAKNKELKQAGRPLISRYHASDCSGRHGEFKGWTRDERDAFVLGLFGILKRIPFHTIAFNTQLDELCEVFPEWANDRLDAAYGLLTTFNLYLIGQEFEVFAQHGRPPKITLFHDRTASDGKYDPTLLSGETFTVSVQVV